MPYAIRTKDLYQGRESLPGEHGAIDKEGA